MAAEATEMSVASDSSMVNLLSGYFSERVLLIGADGTIVSSLGRPQGMLGFDADERDGMHVAERVHPDDLPAVLDLLARARRSRSLEEAVQVRARHKDGSWCRLEVTVFSRVDDPDVNAGVLRVREVGDQGPVVGDVGERFVSLAEALPTGVLSADAENFLVYSNDAALSLLNAGFARLRGRGWLERIHPAHRSAVAEAIAAARSTGGQTQTTFATVDPSAPAWLNLLVVPLLQGDRYVGWVATLEDVTARLASERELAHRATHDALTGLPNRWLVSDRLGQAIARCAPGQRGLAVVFIDVDGLKVHNDSHGHAAGDAVLVHVARRLDHEVLTSGSAARIGGDEFVVIAEVDDDHQAEHLTRRLEHILNSDLQYAGTCLTVTGSVGLAYTDDPTTTPDQLLAAADAAMYRSKDAGRRPPRAADVARAEVS